MSEVNPCCLADCLKQTKASRFLKWTVSQKVSLDRNIGNSIWYWLLCQKFYHKYINISFCFQNNLKCLVLTWRRNVRNLKPDLAKFVLVRREERRKFWKVNKIHLHTSHHYLPLFSIKHGQKLYIDKRTIISSTTNKIDKVVWKVITSSLIILTFWHIYDILCQT